MCAPTQPLQPFTSSPSLPPPTGPAEQLPPGLHGRAVPEGGGPQAARRDGQLPAGGAGQGAAGLRRERGPDPQPEGQNGGAGGGQEDAARVDARQLGGAPAGRADRQQAARGGGQPVAEGPEAARAGAEPAVAAPPAGELSATAGRPVRPRPAHRTSLAHHLSSIPICVQEQRQNEQQHAQPSGATDTAAAAAKKLMFWDTSRATQEHQRLEEELMTTRIREMETLTELKELRLRVMELETQVQVSTNQLRRQDEEAKRVRDQLETALRGEKDAASKAREQQHRFV